MDNLDRAIAWTFILKPSTEVAKLTYTTSWSTCATESPSKHDLLKAKRSWEINIVRLASVGLATDYGSDVWTAARSYF